MLMSPIRRLAHGILSAGVLLACSDLPSTPTGSAADGGSRNQASDAGTSWSSRRWTDANLKLAFFGDQGVNAQAQRLLELVVDEKVDALVVLGDLSYGDATPVAWEAQLNNALGEDFPVFVVVGNHDLVDWDGENGFAALTRKRLTRMPDAHCEGEYSVKAKCTFRGLSFVMSGVGTVGSEHEQYLESALLSSDAGFRMCLWHKNQHDMQVGSKEDEVGWEAYQVCARHGVPIITGHEHSYSRTLALSAVGDSAQMHGATGDADNVELFPGRTFTIVSGLGGQSRRVRTKDHALDGWWAAVYAEGSQIKDGMVSGTEAQIQDGALFVTFNVDGDRQKARGSFKTVDGVVQDEFTWRVSAQGTE